jgi:hypothetical protein
LQYAELREWLLNGVKLDNRKVACRQRLFSLRNRPSLTDTPL